MLLPVPVRQVDLRQVKRGEIAAVTAPADLGTFESRELVHSVPGEVTRFKQALMDEAARLGVGFFMPVISRVASVKRRFHY